MTKELKIKMQGYGVKVVPTTIIDCNNRVVEFLIFPGYVETIYIAN
jgi:hypothetical protein